MSIQNRIKKWALFWDARKELLGRKQYEKWEPIMQQYIEAGIPVRYMPPWTHMHMLYDSLPWYKARLLHTITSAVDRRL